MKLAGQIKSVSYFKANAPEIIENITETGNPVILTVNGEARVIVQDMHSYEKTQETLAMMKVLAMGDKAIREGKTRPAHEAMARVRQRLKRKYP